MHVRSPSTIIPTPIIQPIPWPPGTAVGAKMTVNVLEAKKTFPGPPSPSGEERVISNGSSPVSPKSPRETSSESGGGSGGRVFANKARKIVDSAGGEVTFEGKSAFSRKGLLLTPPSTVNSSPL